MFNHVEEKLKTFAVVNFVCVIIIAVFFFFAFILEFLDEGFLIAVLSLITYCAVVYCLLASCWFMHAFAEILEGVGRVSAPLDKVFRFCSDTLIRRFFCFLEVIRNEQSDYHQPRIWLRWS